MQRILLCILLCSLLLFSFSQRLPSPPSPGQLKNYREANELFRQAEKQAELADDDEMAIDKANQTYQLALNRYNEIIPSLAAGGQDSLQFFVLLKKGLIHFYLDSLDAAKQAYLAAISLHHKIPAVRDSFLFMPYLYTGGFYYTQHDPDSALWYYKKAEELASRYSHPLAGSERLFNRLGAYYYETGNYQKAKNFFEKAISLTSDTGFLNNYKINIASLLIKLEKYDEAKNIYTGLPSSSGFENEVYHNLAIINLKQQHFNDAISWLQKVDYVKDRKSIDLYYNYGLAYSGLNQIDSAEFYLQRALAENLRWNGKRKNIQLGLILKYQADELAKQQIFKEATAQYQLSINQFISEYSEPDPNKNPVQFTGAYSYINLFNTLIAKAASFEGWYQQEKNIKLLEASLNAYRAAFNLGEYVEKTYDSDEARLFLGKIKYTAHSKPINVSLLLFDLTRKKNYLEEAYFFDQQNKASALSANVLQQEYRTALGTNDKLQIEESSLKKAITRLSINATRITDSASLAAIHQSILDKEIDLGKTREKLKDDPQWKELMAAEQIPSISELQKKLDHRTALLSYHLSENELLILLITQSRFEYSKSVINRTFFNSLESFKTSLHEVDGNKAFTGNTNASRLYEKLIAPISNKLMQIKRLIIIPDDELHYLPFEALREPGQKWLIEHFSIQYQYSTALLNRPGNKKQEAGNLSFAPFTKNGFTDSSGVQLSALPASEKEVSNLPGQVYRAEEATKANFLRSADKFNRIHLATHAKVNNEDPARSYIAFYPENENYRLYAPEISNLELDSVDLVILSACETGTGQLVKGEGLMSLSRSFAYAGCPNIITSLWKAEDRNTAFLTQQLHIYLDKNYTKDQALQQAKLDLLANEKIDPLLKSPAYWAHLVFIGDYEPRPAHSRWWWIAFAFIAGAIIYKLLGKKKEEVD